ncbi:MAG: MBL fold metallo-hydrolase [Candidatus Omnitrophica bacterium]|nr:MBL fold metallo-hydrolase [Candidatus Omnitrophota bacterium]
MLIKVVFDKTASSNDFKIGWGFSVLVDGRVLFDTGEKGEWLLHNLRFLGADIGNIEAAVISHDHWDHWGGFWDLLRQKRGIRAYICPGFSREFRDRADREGLDCMEVRGTTEIAPGIFSTGQIPGSYRGKYMAEQALMLRTPKGVSVITGCAHPGIVKIVEKVKCEFPEERIYLVAGGFHLKDSDRRAVETVVENFKKMDILKAGPAHCSGALAEGIFKRAYGDDFIQIKAGQEIEV